MRMTKEQRTRISDFMRDRRNERFARRKLDEAAEALEADFNDALQLIDEADKSKGSLEEDVGRLTKEKFETERALKSLPQELTKKKNELTALLEEIEAKKRESAELDRKMESARAVIARGEEMHKLLGSLAAQ